MRLTGIAGAGRCRKQCLKCAGINKWGFPKGVVVLYSGYMGIHKVCQFKVSQN